MTSNKTTPAPAPKTARRLPGLLILARGGLLWERLWPAIWPLMAVLYLFLALALLDVLSWLPGWLHAVVLLGLAGGAARAAWRNLPKIRLPSAAQARRRVEMDSALPHRPLETLDDVVAGGADDPASVELWTIHQQRLRGQLSKLRLGLPRAGLAAVDPYAVRAGLGLLLVVGLAAGLEDWPQRLQRAVSPDIGTLAAAPPVQFDVWINPPAYTAQPPLFLNLPEPQAAPLVVPAGSIILAQLQGGRGTPSLQVGEQATPFEPVTADAYRVTQEIRTGDRLVIAQDDRELAAWALKVLPDTAPSIEFLSAPGRSERAALRLDYLAEDDYGLARVSARIQRIDDPSVAPMDIELALPGLNLRRAEGRSFHDLTPHPWAGLAVEISLIAEDALGQRNESDPARTVLPERIFNHPVARALVELRKQLTLNPRARQPVADTLGEIYDRPDHYFHDIVVALSLSTAERRLRYDQSDDAIGHVQKLLWDTALHIEEGELAIAERDLRDVQQALMDALARGASDEEIERLMSELQQALNRFLEALAEQMREQMAEGTEMQPVPPDAQLLQSGDLQRLIERARELARTGARDAARDLLSQLQNMLENLRTNPYAQGMNEESQDAMRMMQEMDDIRQRQQELLDRSFERSQERDPDLEDQERMQQQSQGDAMSQEELRRQLGELMRGLGDTLGDIPRPLGRAEQSMRDARDALGTNRSQDAIRPQTRAIDQLQQGMEAMAQRFMEQMGNAARRGMGQVGGQRGTGQDPFGRETGNSGLEALEGVEIPDEMETRRTRKILDELRRRRGERKRPPLELDYIDRLLRQF